MRDAPHRRSALKHWLAGGDRQARLSDDLAGRRLYGDDLTPEELQRWYEREAEAYAAMAGPSDDGGYGDHALNRRHMYAHLPAHRFEHVLLFGGAAGEELLPIAHRVDRATILDSSQTYGTAALDLPVERVQARSDGDLPFEDATFDLITCFGVLHHIAGVSHVFAEMARVLRPGGFLLVRETTVSMGDWSVPRPRLTPCERGIPMWFFRRLVAASPFELVASTRCMASGGAQVAKRLGLPRPFNSEVWVRLDALACRALSRNRIYHPTAQWQRFRPLAVALVLRKTG